jgi:hypothetical protein
MRGPSRRAESVVALAAGLMSGESGSARARHRSEIGRVPRGDHHQRPVWAGKNRPRGLCADAEGVDAASPQVSLRLTGQRHPSRERAPVVAEVGAAGGDQLVAGHGRVGAEPRTVLA